MMGAAANNHWVGSRQSTLSGEQRLGFVSGELIREGARLSQEFEQDHASGPFFVSISISEFARASNAERT